MSVRRARRRDLRLVPVALAAWASAALMITFPEAAPVSAAAAALAVVALVVAGCRRARGRGVVAIAVLCCAVAGGVALQVVLASGERAAVATLPIDGGRAVTFEAIVVGKVEAGPAGVRFDAVAVAARVAAVERTVSAPILVRAPAAVRHLDVGAEIVLTGSAFRTDAGERAVLVVDAARIEVRAPPQGALAVTSALRAGFHAITTGLPQPGAGLVAGLAVGDTAGVSAELDAQMKTSSLSHLTAVSGANCAIIVGVSFALAALCGARRGMRIAVALVALAGFVLLVTPEPSVVRAAVMAAVAMLGLLLGRVGAGLSLLTAAATGILLADPWLSLSLGFALSAAATAALLLLAGPLADGLARTMPAPLALAISVPLAAQLACGPLLVLIAPSVPLQGVLANLLAGPAAPAATLAGLAACLTAGIPVIGVGLAGMAWVPAAWIAATAETFADLPVVPWPEGPPGALLLAGLGIAVSVAIGAPRGRARAAAVVVVCAAAGLLVGAGPGAVVTGRMTLPGGWAVAACDVGQGDAVLLRSGERVMLVDTGPDPETLGACLDRFGVGRIDLLVLTHFDADHRGGFDAVLGRVGTLLHGPAGDAGAERLLERARAAGAAVREVEAGESGVLGEAAWRVLWPRRGAAAGNDASIVVDVAGGGIPSTLLLGDLSEEPQRRLAAAPSLRRGYDIVKVAHHGSADQSVALYQAARPAVALVTVGENDYGHPRGSILATLASVGALTTRTDRGGDVVVWSEGDVLRVWRPRADEVGRDG